MKPLSVLLDTAICMSGLSAAEVARRSGVHFTTLSNCRRNREPDPHTLERVLDALGLDIELIRAKVKSGASGQFFVSPHALTRYIERIRGRLSREQALTELIELSADAVLVRSFEDGRQLWQGPDRPPAPRLRFIVAPQSEGTLPTIETVPPRRRQRRTYDHDR